MPYDTPAMGGVSASMPGPGGDEHEDAPPGGDDTAYLPASVTGDHKWQEGDKIELEVVSVDEDGSLEVRYSQGGGESPKPGDQEIDALPD